MDRYLSRRTLLARGAFLLSTVAAVTASAACGQPTVSTTASATHSASAAVSTASSAAPTTATVSSTAAAKAPAGNGQSLYVLTADHTPATEDWFAKTFNPAFQKAHGLAVQMVYTGWGDELNTKRDGGFAAGQGPDILISGAAMVIDYTLHGFVRPLDDYLARWPDNADFFTAATGATTRDGKRYGVPTRVDARTMIYRSDLMRNAGLDPAQLPVVWDDVKTLAIKLTAQTGGAVTRLGYDPSFGNQQFFAYLWQNGGDVISADGRHALFASSAGIDTLQYWSDLIGQIDPPGTKLPPVPAGMSALGTGTIATALTGNGAMFTIATGTPNSVPDIAVGMPTKRQAQVVNVFNNWHGIGTQTKVVDQAWAWLSSLGSKDNLLAYNQSLSGLPPRTSLQDSTYVHDPKYQLDKFATVVQQYARPQPLVAAYLQCWNIVDAALKDVIAKKQTARDALTSAAQQWDAALATAYNNAG